MGALKPIHNRRLRSAVTLFVAAALVSSCGGAPKSGDSGGGATIAIGLSADFSGPLSAYGLGWRQGAQAYVQSVNDSGGVDGHHIQYVTLDDASDGARAAQNATQLVTTDHVVALAAPFSQTCTGIIGVAEPRHVPVICNALPADVLQPPRPDVFSETLLYAKEAGPMEEVAEKVLGEAPERVAILHDVSAGDQPLIDALEHLFQSRGIDIAADEEVPLSATDVSAQAAKIIAAQPDAVFTIAADPTVIALGRALAQSNVTVPLIGHTGSGIETLRALKSPHFYSLQNVAIGGSSAYDAFANLLREDNADLNATFSGLGYLQAMVTVDALKKCGYPCDGEQLEDAMSNLTVDTAGFTSAPVEFSPNSHEGIHAMFAYAWDTAKNEPIVFAQNLQAGTGG